MPHKVMYVEDIELHVYQKSFRVCDDAIGSEIVFPPTITEDTIKSLVTAIYNVVERDAKKAALMKVEEYLHKQMSKALINSMDV